MTPPRFPGYRCNCQSRLGDRKEQSGLLPDRWIVTRDGDTITVKRNPKYDIPTQSTVNKSPVFETRDIPPYLREDLTDKEKQVVKSWVDDSDPINFASRGVKDHQTFLGKPELFEESLVSAGILSEVIKKSELRQAYPVTRGLKKHDIDQVKSALEENERTGYAPLLTDAGFLAVTYDDTVSLGYSTPDKYGEYFVLKSHLLKGTKALFIGNQNDFTRRIESEILLQRGCNYYIVGDDIVVVTDSDGTEKLVHYIEVIFIE
ncbi:MAG: hypothetical protein JXA44_06440 [Methanospirillaceae archaeon]|nr:hypothetical protein [Methanospirillaceae archaeon]